MKIKAPFRFEWEEPPEKRVWLRSVGYLMGASNVMATVWRGDTRIAASAVYLLHKNKRIS